ncbi:MAG: DUF1398 domain-containing protein [Candidatus Margulisiibacteriota bacterium]
MTPIDQLNTALAFAMKHRPKVGGFPVLAEVLRQAGVTRNMWELPSCQSLYVMASGTVVNQGVPLISGMAEVPSFDEAALIHALRQDQAGYTTFPKFLMSAWKAGVVHYEVDFAARTVAYYGRLGEVYLEAYPAVEGVTFA